MSHETDKACVNCGNWIDEEADTCHVCHAAQNKRLIVIGDVHGHSDALIAILNEIEPTDKDTFIFLGDLVDRGPDSKGVIDEVARLKQSYDVKVICGNHEEMVLAAFQGGKSDHAFWCKFGGKEALASFGATVDHVTKIPGAYLRFIAECVDYVETDTHIFVHAWCHPEKSPAESGGDILRWYKLPPVPPPHVSGKTVVCGHTAQGTIADHVHTICIDTSCGVSKTGILTAMDVISGDTWQYSTMSHKIVNKGKNVYHQRSK